MPAPLRKQSKTRGQSSRRPPANHGVRHLTNGLAGVKEALGFVVHCWRRAAYLERTMVREVSFEEMVSHLSPLAARIRPETENAPEGWIARTAEGCACLFPRIWRRRCLFRSLLVLDWAHRAGLSPTLNVGMKLGPHRDQGHCWLSMGRTPFCEPAGWPDQYATLVHQSDSLQYWVALAPDAQGRETSVPVTERMGGPA